MEVSYTEILFEKLIRRERKGKEKKRETWKIGESDEKFFLVRNWLKFL